MQQIDQQVFEASLPAIAWLVSYLIQQMHWKDSTNTAIAGTTVIFAGLGSVFFQHRLTPNVLSDFLLIATLATGLQSSALAPLSQWLKEIGSQQPTSSTWQPSQYDTKESRAVGGDPQRTQYGMPGEDMPPRG